MLFITKRTLLTIFSTIVVITIISCENTFKEASRIKFSQFIPAGDADKINLKYTDSGKIRVIMISPKMLDFADQPFPFTEFPKGMNMTIYDKAGKRVFIRSNYAVSYKMTNVIDLQGNVRINSENGQTMETEQLYYNQRLEWFYTYEKFKFTDNGVVSYGTGVDFNKNFTTIYSQEVSGEVQTQ